MRAKSSPDWLVAGASAAAGELPRVDRLHGLPVRKLPLGMWYLLISFLISLQGSRLEEVAGKQREVHDNHCTIAIEVAIGITRR